MREKLRRQPLGGPADEAEQAAHRVYKAAMREQADTVGTLSSEADRELAREYIDRWDIRHPGNRMLTLDGRPAPRGKPDPLIW